MNQMASDACAVVMPDRESVRANISVPMSESPIETSYETICAEERRPPRSAYFEFEDQPARMSASTPTEEIERTNRRPMFTSVMTPQFGAKGTTENVRKVAATEMYGANRKMYGSAFSGIRS